VGSLYGSIHSQKIGGIRNGGDALGCLQGPGGTADNRIETFKKLGQFGALGAYFFQNTGHAFMFGLCSAGNGLNGGANLGDGSAGFFQKRIMFTGGSLQAFDVLGHFLVG